MPRPGVSCAGADRSSVIGGQGAADAVDDRKRVRRYAFDAPADMAVRPDQNQVTLVQRRNARVGNDNLA